MEELLKQELLSLLNAAKTHIEEGEAAEAIEKIEAAIANLEDEGVATADEGEGGSEGEGEDGDGLKGEDGKEEKPKPRPLPGQGSNGQIVP